MKKKLFTALLAFLFVFVVAACTRTEDPVDRSPVIFGAEDRTIERGAGFVPLEGITAEDFEGNDLTAEVQYSGNVNPNVAGTYQANYTVSDAEGNTATVSVTITVIDVDTEPPLISGAGNVTVMIGDPDFTLLGGVTANDTVDGDVTEDLEVEGDFDLWTPGTYTVTYRVSDSAGNEAVRERTITVSLGDFVFEQPSVLLNGTFAETLEPWVIEGTEALIDDGLVIDMDAPVSLSQSDLQGGSLNPDVADFVLFKLEIDYVAGVTQPLSVALTGAHTMEMPVVLEAGTGQLTLYLRLEQPLEEGTLTLNFDAEQGGITINAISLLPGSAEDTEPPVITVPDTEVIAPTGNIEALRQLVLRGVTAQDNIDGNVTSGLTIDLDGLDLETPGTVDIPIVSIDNAGNEARVMRPVQLKMAFDTGVIQDPTFSEALDTDQWGLSGGSDSVSLYTEDGLLVVDIGHPGGWDSASSPFLRNVTTDDLQAGNYYMFSFDVRAERSRQLRLRAGLELWSDPWIEDFMDGAVRNLQYTITSEWRTIHYVFYVDEAFSADGSNVVKFEIKVGTITWGSEEIDNKVFIDNAQFYLLSMQDEPPVITRDETLPTTFGSGEDMPDFTSYVTVQDLEDGAMPVTWDMIDVSALDMDTPGIYPVVFTAIDSAGNVTEYTLDIQILEEADTEAPQLTLDENLPTTFDQFADIEVDLSEYVGAVDNIDGEINLRPSMIDAGGFSLQTAGVYTVIYTVTDSSGNTATLELELTVLDKEPPHIQAPTERTMTIGEVFDPLAGIQVMDNVDGAITLTLDHVSGYEVFTDEAFVTIEAGSFEVLYTVTDEAGNTATHILTVHVADIDFDEENPVDLLGLEIPVQNDGGTVESSGEYQEDGSLIVTYNGVAGWYGSYSKITYYPVELEEGMTYKLVIEAKAETARDILVRFVGSNGEAVTAFANRLVVGLEETFAVYELIFTVDQPGPYDIQLQFGWEGNLNNVTDPNVMTFNSFKLLPEKVMMYDYDAAYDMLAEEASVGNDGGNIEASGEYQEDGSLIVTYNGVTGWYGSYSKLTFFPELEEGRTYKLVIDMEAESARDVLLRFVDQFGAPIDVFEGRYALRVEESRNVVEIVFEAPSSGSFDLQMQFGWEDFLYNTQDANVLTIHTFKLVPAAE